MEKRTWILECSLSEPHEALDIPLPQQFLVRIEIDGEVKEIRHESDGSTIFCQAAWLQDIQPLKNQDVWSVNGDAFARKHVIRQVRVNRGFDIALSGFDCGEKPYNGRRVVAFGKSLTLHQAQSAQLGIWQQKTVGCNQLNLGCVGPARQQRLEHTRRG